MLKKIKTYLPESERYVFCRVSHKYYPYNQSTLVKELLVKELLGSLTFFRYPEILMSAVLPK